MDATNYIMYSLGQPLHAYDMAKLKDESGNYLLRARVARKSEKVKTLDGKEYEMDENMQVISDGMTGDSALGIAGIKGGEATKIDKNTKSIIIESANFHPVNIRKTATKLGLRTDASIRFGNEISPELTLPAIFEASRLVVKIAGTEKTAIEGICDKYPRRTSLYKVGFSLSEVQSTLGIDISQNEIQSILNRRGYEWEEVFPREKIMNTAEGLVGVPYKYGSSILSDAPTSFDCSSLSSYLYIQSGISLPRISVDQYVFTDEVKEQDARPGDLVFANTGKVVNTSGLYYSKVLDKNIEEVPIRSKSVEFIPGTEVEGGIDHVGIYFGNGEVLHSTKDEGGVIKENLLDSKNFKNFRGFRAIKSLDEKRFVVTIPPERLDLRIKEDLIEEVGRIYGYENIPTKKIKNNQIKPEVNKDEYYGNIIRGILISKGFSEIISYTFVKKGEIELINPLAGDKKFLRNNLTDGIKESLDFNIGNALLLGLEQIKVFEIGNVFPKSGEVKHLAFGIKNPKGSKKEKSEDKDIEETVNLLEKELAIKTDFKINNSIAECDWSSILAQLEDVEIAHIPKKLSQARYKKPSTYPFVLRDIAILHNKELLKEKLTEVIKDAGGDTLKIVKLFDEFSPDKENISSAFHLVFVSDTKTLTDDEVNETMALIEEQIRNNGWKVR